MTSGGGAPATDRTVLVPPDRVGRWFDNFAARHGGVTDLLVRHGALVAAGADGGQARASLPFSRPYDGQPDVGSFTAAVAHEFRWGLLLVRKGGFAIAVAEGARLLGSKVGQRHVQGRTKAGGQSQQRFARRRVNQARQAYEAAADHAHRILVLEHPGSVALVCGGDHTAVEQVLDDPRLAVLRSRRAGPWLAVPDPRRAVLDQAIVDGRSAVVEVLDPPAVATPRTP
jgi:hypothetical protein